MKQISAPHWVAIALAFAGFLLSAIGGDSFSKLGGSMTLLAIVFAVYGFLSKNKKREMGGEHHE
jgi:EamA domain-containing membrane protein RarD